MKSPHPSSAPSLPISAAAPPAANKKVTFQFSRHGEEARLRAIARSRRILSKASLRLESIDSTSTDLVNSIPEEGACYHSRYAPHYSPSPKALASQRRFGSKENLDASSSSARSRGESAGTDGRSVLTVESRETRDGTGSMSSILFYEKGHRLPAARAQPMDEREEGEMEELVSGERKASWANDEIVGVLLSTPAKGSTPSSDCGPTSFFVLLLCPTSRIFELVEVNGDGSGEGEKPSPSDSALSTVGDVLRAASANCTDDRLSSMEFVGLVRPKDRAEFTSMDAMAFASSESPAEDDCEEKKMSFKHFVALLLQFRGSNTATVKGPDR